MKKKIEILVLCIAFGMTAFGLYQLSSLFTIRGDMVEVRNIMNSYIKEFDEMKNSVQINSTISEIELVESAMQEKIDQWETNKYMIQSRLEKIDTKSHCIKHFMEEGEYGAIRGEIGALWGRYGILEGTIGSLQGELTVLKMGLQ